LRQPRGEKKARIVSKRVPSGEASVFVPYLPMVPIQILANNMLYDISQTAIPTDEVDPEQVE
jgi:hypothetical protein